ncbi:MAG: DNA adenine methylase [Dehalococcoidia bacterium]|nr:DNA adenine methylase [Dehalococcoidia bacterium]
MLIDDVVAIAKRPLKSPLFWYGGKWRLASRVVALLPPHKTYVEPFGGAAYVLFAKEPSVVEVYNDIDGDLVNFFRVLRDPEKAAELQRRLVYTPYSRSEYRYACERFSDPDLDDVERARLFFVATRQSFSGQVGQGWGYSVGRYNDDRRQSRAHQFRNAVDDLHRAAERLRTVQVECLDYREVLRKYDTPQTVFYCDPPYHPSTRRDLDCYRYEMNEQDHTEFIDMMLQLQGMALVSGYDCEEYRRLDAAGWRRFEFASHAHAAGRTAGTGLLGASATDERHRRTEVVWMNPACARCMETQPLLPLWEAAMDSDPIYSDEEDDMLDTAEPQL